MATTPLNIKEEIRKLVQLQDIDSQIFALKKERAEHPRLLEEIQRRLEICKARLKSLEDTKQKQLLRQKEREVELGSKEDAIKKSQSQLGQLKTNKEYQVKLTEIESLKADKSLIEEEILKLMDEVDVIKKNIDGEKKNVEAEEKKCSDEKTALSLRAKDIEALLQHLDGRRKILVDAIDKKSLERYEYILHGKDGLALVKVQENSCQGCYMHVPAQVINEIKMHERLITCEMCARILYLQEDVQF